MNLIPIFKKINFVSRYETLCSKHNNFDNGLRGNKTDLYEEVLRRLAYSAKYFKNERFYKVEQSLAEYIFTLHLTLKDGLVETHLYIKKNGELCIPNGRFDFIPERMEVDFDREKYNIPSYTSGVELEEILKEIFSIYEDIKKEVITSDI